MACRLYGILARKAPRAVILRRGGTNRVRLILWHTNTDEFECGQWFIGRIFGQLSDLSPDGSLFVYAAGRQGDGNPKHPEYGYAWTAISHPPYLTALALWPAARAGEPGSMYDGGGLFLDQRTVLLDHRAGMTEPHPDHRPKKGLRIVFAERPHFGFPDPSGSGTLPMEFYRLVRDGWQVVQRIEFERSRRWSRLVQPWILERPAPDGGRVLVLRDDHNYVWGGKGRQYAVRDFGMGQELPLTGVEWAEWDHIGRLVFGRGCELLAAQPGQPIEEAMLLADFGSQTFEPISTPDWATRW